MYIQDEEGNETLHNAEKKARTNHAVIALKVSGYYTLLFVYVKPTLQI